MAISCVTLIVSLAAKRLRASYKTKRMRVCMTTMPVGISSVWSGSVRSRRMSKRGGIEDVVTNVGVLSTT